VRNNTPLNEIDKIPFKGIILSPGPETPEKSGHLMEFIKEYYREFPILGICLGHQALGTFLGATLVKATRPMHGKISRIHVEPDYLFDGIKTSFNVVRYHSLILRDLSPDVVSIGNTSINEIMAIRHVKLNIRGVQFHPEAALSEYGLDVLTNWVNHNSLAV